MLPAYAESRHHAQRQQRDVFWTQYVDRGITNSAEQSGRTGRVRSDYKEIFYAGIWGSNVNFGAGAERAGRSPASKSTITRRHARPWANGTSILPTYYVTYPGAFDPDGEFDYVEIWTGVSRASFLDDKLELTLDNYWSPEYFGETGDNDVLELSSEWTFNKVWYFTPKLGGKLGHQWGDLSQGGYDYTYWSVALTLGFNEKPPLELEIRYWDSFHFTGFTCPPSGVDACNNLVVGSLKATF